jgi:hypothetical protein
MLVIAKMFRMSHCGLVAERASGIVHLLEGAPFFLVELAVRFMEEQHYVVEESRLGRHTP